MSCLQQLPCCQVLLKLALELPGVIKSVFEAELVCPGFVYARLTKYPTSNVCPFHPFWPLPNSSPSSPYTQTQHLCLLSRTQAVVDFSLQLFPPSPTILLTSLAGCCSILLNIVSCLAKQLPPVLHYAFCQKRVSDRRRQTTTIA